VLFFNSEAEEISNILSIIYEHKTIIEDAETIGNTCRYCVM
jgi:hypothetical protein